MAFQRRSRRFIRPHRSRPASHLIRNSLDLASWKDRKLSAAALKPIYQAATAVTAAAALQAFAQGEWGTKFPTVPAV